MRGPRWLRLAAAGLCMMESASGESVSRDLRIEVVMGGAAAPIANPSSFTVSYGTAWKYNVGPPAGKTGDGDSYATTWSNDDVIYGIVDDTRNFGGEVNSNLAIYTLDSPSIPIDGTLINPMTPYGSSNQQLVGGNNLGGTFKANGIISVAGALYVSVSQQGTQVPTPAAGVVSEDNGTILISSDHGVNWSSTAPAPPYTQPPSGPAPFPTGTTMFSGRTFAAPNFIQYGKDYQGNTADNSGTYVYATSNEGCWNNCSQLFLGRVLITDLPSLTGSTWQFYQGVAGGDGTNPANWSTSWSTATPLITSSAHIGNVAQAQYIKEWGVYFWIGWYYPDATSVATINSSIAVWDFYTSPHPWGPWTLVNSKTWNSEPGVGLYSPNIITKSISVVGTTATMNITTAGDYKNPGVDYTLTVVPLTVTAH